MDKIGWLFNKRQDLTKSSSKPDVPVPSSGFTIRLDGGPIQGSTATTGYVYLLIDCSGSMKEHNKLEQAKARSLDFANLAQSKGYLVGLITFSTDALNLCNPQADASVLQKHLKGIEAKGTTNMGRGISLASSKLVNLPGKLFMVIVTDGRPNSRKNALSKAMEAKNAGIVIQTIGTDDAELAFLQLIASRIELATKVAREKLGQAIVDAAKMLPAPHNKQL